MFLQTVYNFAGSGEHVAFDIFRFDADGRIAEHWDKILYESIPLFINAKTTRQYHLAIYWMISKLKDTHSVDRKSVV